MKAAFIGIGAVFALLVVVFFGTALGYRSDCVRLEARIKTQYKQNQNNYDNMWKKFREMAQVPGQYVEDMKNIWGDTMRGRYGADGSKALFQFIKEQNPQLDASLYTKLQAAIEAGRNSFMAEQQQLLDIKREYEVVLQGNRALFVGWLFGFPKIDLDEYDIVTSDETQDTFKDKKSDEVDVFNKKKVPAAE
ncbi:MAG: hypothetical protein WCT10_05715 [Patescibacteria group bacterium]